MISNGKNSFIFRVLDLKVFSLVISGFIIVSVFSTFYPSIDGQENHLQQKDPITMESSLRGNLFIEENAEGTRRDRTLITGINAEYNLTKLTINEETIEIQLLEPRAGTKIRSGTTINISFDPIPSYIFYRWDGQGEWSGSTGVDRLTIDSPTTQGNHFIEVKANNSYNGWFEKSWAFKVDDVSIFFTLISPEELGTYNSWTEVVITMDPTPVGVLYAWDNDTYSSLLRPMPVGDGYHILKVMAEDSDGNWYSSVFEFYVDDTPPEIALSEVNNSQLRSKTAITIATISNDTDKMWYNWDGTINKTIASEDDIAVPNGGGWHMLNIYANDSINNRVKYTYRFYATIRISLVDHPLVISYEEDFKTNGVMYANSNITIPLNFSDVTRKVYYNWWVNGSLGINSTTLNNTPMEGSNNLYIYAEDYNGYWDTLELIVFIDNEIPVIDEYWYLNNSVLLGDTPVLFEYSEEINKALYSWDGQDNGTDYKGPIDIGKHNLTLYIQDYALNWNSYQLVYYTKYNVSLVNVINGSYLEPGTEITVSFYPEPDNTLYSWDGNTPTSTIDQLPEISGWHTLNVSTRDQNGHWYFDLFKFQTILLVRLIAPRENLPTQTTTVELEFSETPLTTLYSWDNAINSTFLHDTPTDDGDHWLHIYVENNDIPTTVWFAYHFHLVIDNTPPTAPTWGMKDNGTRINSNTEMTMEFTENCTIYLYWDNHLNESTLVYTSALDEPLSLPAIPTLSDGIHYLYMNITDEANNSVVVIYEYLFDSTPIEVLLNYPNNGSIIRPAIERVNITFEEEPTKVYYYVTGYSTANTSKLPTLPYTNGTISLTIYVYDGLNWNKVVYQFIVVHYYTKLLGVTPTNGTLINNKTKFTLDIEGNYTQVMYQWTGSENSSKNVVPSVSGNYSLIIWLEDISGEWLSWKYYYEVDNDSPQLVEITPTNKESPPGGKVELTFSEKVYLITYKWSTEDNYSSINIPAGNYTIGLVAPEVIGNHTLEIWIEDKVGNELYLQEYFLVKKPFEESLFQTAIDILPVGFVLLLAVVTVLSRQKIKQFIIEKANRG